MKRLAAILLLLVAVTAIVPAPATAVLDNINCEENPRSLDCFWDVVVAIERGLLEGEII